MRRIRLTRGLIAATVLLCAAPAAAEAVRYASPTGGAPIGGTCPQSSPCSLADAVAGVGITDGELIRLLGGTYTVSGLNVGVFNRITIEPDPGVGRPLVRNTGGSTFVFAAGSAGSILRDVDIAAHDNATGDALNAQEQITLERVRVTATGTTTTGVTLQGTMRDSVVSVNADFGTAILTRDVVNLRNVTAIASSTNSEAILVDANLDTSQTVGVRNVIARGVTHGIEVRDNGPGGGTLSANVAFSNFSDAIEDASVDSDLVLGGGNQTQAPLFANPGGGDFRQLPGSPTIDKGTLDGLVGATDFDGQPRIQGAAPDIGADEATDPNALFGFGEVGKLRRTRTIQIPAQCPLVNCNASVAANLVVKGTADSAAAAKVLRLKPQTISLTGGQPGTITFKLTKKQFKKLRRAKKARLTVSVSAIDSLGFTGTDQGSFKFRKSKKKK